MIFAEVHMITIIFCLVCDLISHDFHQIPCALRRIPHDFHMIFTGSDMSVLRLYMVFDLISYHFLRISYENVCKMPLQSAGPYLVTHVLGS